MKYEDILSEVFSTPVSNVKEVINSYNEYIDENTQLELEYKRVSPVSTLKQLVDNPEDLLEVMKDLKVVLRADAITNYFCPGLIADELDWKFVCTSSMISVYSLCYFLSNLGVKWKDCRELSTAKHPEGEVYSIWGKLERGNKTLQVSVQWHSLFYTVASYWISKSYSSITTCFFTGFAAVSWYDAATSRKLAFKFQSSTDNFPDVAEHSRILKYNNSFDFISYQEYCKLVNNDAISFYGTWRQSMDKDCKVIPFKPFLSQEKQKSYNDIYVRNLKYIIWSEKDCFIDYHINRVLHHVDKNHYLSISIPTFLLKSDSMYYKIMAAQLESQGIGMVNLENQSMLAETIKSNLVKGNSSLNIPITTKAWLNLLVLSDNNYPEFKYTHRLPC